MYESDKNSDLLLLKSIWTDTFIEAIHFEN